MFYERFVKGRWVAVFGAVYPFMDNERMYCDIPSDIESWAVSCDYGTVNPASFGLWGRKNGVWYRVDEYYFNSRTQGFQKTDEEHYDGLEKLIDGRKIECVIVDPSAASFIEVIRRHGKYTVVSAEKQCYQRHKTDFAGFEGQKNQNLQKLQSRKKGIFALPLGRFGAQ